MRFLVTAGHSNKDPGAVANGVTEAALMTKLRDIVATKLRDLGHTVITDGTPGVNLPLVQAIALLPMSDFAVELHTNASTDPAARGVEVVSLPKHKDVARLMAANIARTLETRVRADRGWLAQEDTPRGRLGFVRGGGLVVETFFISNPDELRKYQERHWLVASAIVGAMLAGAAL